VHRTEIRYEVADGVATFSGRVPVVLTGSSVDLSSCRSSGDDDSRRCGQLPRPASRARIIASARSATCSFAKIADT
jgi:hypothetical protein